MDTKLLKSEGFRTLGSEIQFAPEIAFARDIGAVFVPQKRRCLSEKRWFIAGIERAHPL